MIYNPFKGTHLKLHGADLVQDFSHVLLDHGPGDLVVALSCGFHRMPGHIVESYHVGENSHRLIEWTEPVERPPPNIDISYQINNSLTFQSHQTYYIKP